MEELGVRRRWWRDLFARLVITVVGGVMVAVIVTVLIPRLLEQQNDTQPAPTEQDAPAEASDGQEAPPDTEAPAEAPGPETTTEGG